MKVIKRIYLLSLIISAVFLFAACEKAKKDEIANDLEALAGTDTSDDEVEKGEVSKVPDTMSCTVTSGGWSTKIDAKIYADGYDNVSAFAVTECEDKDELVLKYAQKLFDKGNSRILNHVERQAERSLKRKFSFTRKGIREAIRIAKTGI